MPTFIDELTLNAGDEGGLWRLMHGGDLVARVGSFDEARARAAHLGIGLAVTRAVIEQLRTRAAIHEQLPADFRLAD